MHQISLFRGQTLGLLPVSQEVYGMTSRYQCLNCFHLGKCKETDEDKVLRGYHCDRWEEVEKEIVIARNNIISLFGIQGVKSILSTDVSTEEEEK
jgi:hypothetical protein